MSTETILILGGSFAGISAAHSVLRHTIPALPKKNGVTYTVTLVNPSKDFYWRIAGPRAAVSKELMPPSKYIYPIAPAFASYPKGSFEFVQGTATSVDTASRSVAVTTATGEQKTITYAALVIATGVKTPAPVFSQTTDTETLEEDLESFRKQIVAAKSVVIGGAGPVGVETAGEIGELLNGSPGFLAGKLKDPKAKVTLVCGQNKMLPILREAISKTAEKYLGRLGVDVLYNTKVVGSTPAGAGGKTTVQLSDGKTLEADVYLDCTGVRPNTQFLPKELLTDRGYVDCNKQTLRVTGAGERVYVIGDVGSYTRGGVMDQYDAIPVAMTNLKTDLIAHVSGKPPGPDRHYKPNLSEQQICPVGRGKGVGAFGGWRVPSIMVWLIKGRDYMSGALAPGTVAGDKFKTEGNWKPELQLQANAGLQK